MKMTPNNALMVAHVLREWGRGRTIQYRCKIAVDEEDLTWKDVPADKFLFDFEAADFRVKGLPVIGGPLDRSIQTTGSLPHDYTIYPFCTDNVNKTIFHIAVHRGMSLTDAIASVLDDYVHKEDRHGLQES